MNKKLNTVIFILAGTLVNLVIALVSIGLLLALVGLASPLMGDSTSSLVPFAFLAGILFSMIAYQKLSKWAISRFNMNDKLDPLFMLNHKKNRAGSLRPLVTALSSRPTVPCSYRAGTTPGRQAPAFSVYPLFRARTACFARIPRAHPCRASGSRRFP